jgi:hypothetical protein
MTIGASPFVAPGLNQIVSAARAVKFLGKVSLTDLNTLISTESTSVVSTKLASHSPALAPALNAPLRGVKVISGVGLAQ